MIRQYCMKCQATVELPDSAGGTECPCPGCGTLLMVPASYHPVVSPGGGVSPPLNPTPPPTPILPPEPEPVLPTQPPLPPGLKLPTEKPKVELPGLPNTTDLGEFSKTYACSLSPTWLNLLPVAGLVLILLLTFFSWNGAYAGGTRLYSQSPWQALFGSMSTNPLPRELLVEEPALEQLLTSNVLILLPYLILLILTTGLAILVRIYQEPTVVNMPGPLAWLPSIWKQRFHLLVGLSLILFVLLLVQSWRGFSLETALEALSTETAMNAIKAKIPDFDEQPDSTPKRQEVAVKIGQELGRFAPQTTTYFLLALSLQFVVFLGFIGQMWLNNRGAKPYPRLAIQW